MSGRARGRIGAAVTASVLVGLMGAGIALSDVSYTDPTVDATGGAPDITQVTVSNDAAGVLTFRVTTVGAVGADSDVYIGLDADANPATGSQGQDYSIFVGVTSFGLDKWNGTDFAETPAGSLTAVRSGNTVEVKVGRQDIGNPTRIGFVAATVIYDAADKYLGEDDAPDGGAFTYVLTFAQCANGKDDDGDGRIDEKDFGCLSAVDNRESDDPVTLRTGKPQVFPAKARAGKFVVVAAPVLRLETGKLITSGVVKCVARVGTKALRGVGKVVSGNAACGFDVPLKAKGKTVRGTITVTHLGRTKVVPFSFKVN